MPLRVCDRCIRKKTKCNQGRPTCSRCFDLGETCNYTSVKRKPGPPIGSHYTSNSSKSRRSSVRDVPADDLSGNETAHPASEGSDLIDPSILTSPSTTTSNQASGSINQLASYSRFPPQQVGFLLAAYFDLIQDANPIFSKELFLHRYQNSLCSEDLVSTIVIITAKLTGFTANEDDLLPGLDTDLDLLLSSSKFEDDLIGDGPSLDQFRKAYLLAFYEFHQFPGHQSWLRVGRVTRMAYRIGIDRLDQIRMLYPDWSILSEEDIQEWRSLWWCIYRLDSYTNISSGTPYLIDDTVISTSLFINHQTSSECVNSLRELYLPPNPEDISKVLLAARLASETLLKNVHNIATTVLRQAGLVLRLHLVRSQEGLIAHVTKLERQLATVRLALPAGWLNPRRNAFLNESHADHHARTVTVLQLRMAQLLLSLAQPGLRQGDEWLVSWQRVYEACQDIASIADQWDSSFCLSVDPAISFTIFTALIFLDLHRKTLNLTEHSIGPDIDHHISILHLQLQHFGKIWTLPRLLMLSFESFSQSVCGPLSYHQIGLILSRFEAPLHPRWLQFLSSANTILADY